jgi:hypothetical protein
MTRPTCPLGEDCDLTVAYMLGRRDASDELARKAVKLALDRWGPGANDDTIAAIIARARKWETG